MKIKDYEGKIEIPEGVEVKIENGIVKISNKDKKLIKELKNKQVSLAVVDKSVVVRFKKGTKREKKIAGTFKAHIKNMFKGVTEGHVYKLKVCSGHFPMSIEFKDNKFVVNNFLGEKTPRVLNIKEGIDVKIEGDIITIESSNKGLAAQTARDIEVLTKIKGKDLRIFQDGCYIINKDGKEII